MKRIKFRIPIDKVNYEFFNAFKWFMDLVEWGYGDTYFFLGSDVVKLVEIKFKEDLKAEEIVKKLLEIPHVRDAKLIPKNDHYLLYVRANIFETPFPKNVLEVFDIQKKGVVVFEKGTFTSKEIYLYVICEDELVGDVISVVKKVYGGELVSIEEYSPEDNPLSKLTGKQLETLLLAYKSGYFDDPRRITLRELAEMLNLSPSTVKEHLRKAQRKIFEELIG
ncbi:helix-turn-helix domain-containing protein [Thermococcus sp.]|uniref:helix-turn-helix domain-containing protein n=1 Tax=Thermococcus sp. TaxID=35749 RepID=UPI00076CD94D|nr:helix-turn-helix domain-containing protein [Thermococcus sp.]KUK27899.1 MAG: putative transcription regulator, containing DNA-binding HTH domain [Thermococcus sp. 40_45]MBC7094416.1 helix-turn-helix domain-containing protein [Thermococcus sp.]